MKTTLGNLVRDGSADYQTGPFGTMLKASEYSSEGSPLISVGEIREGFFTIHDHTPRVCEKIKLKLPQFVLEEGDIVFGRKGAINRNAIIRKSQAGWFLGSDGIRLRLTDKHDPGFFSYFLRTTMIGRWLLSNGQGAIMPSLNQKILDRLPLFLPSKSEQQRISGVLSALDAKIELNNRINEELEGMAKLLYDYWFVQFDFPITAAQAAAMGKPHLKGKPYRASGGKMIYNEALKREIPEGWMPGNLEKLGKIVGGSTPNTKKTEYFCKVGTPWITPKDLSDNSGNRFIDRGSMCVTSEGIKAASLKLLPAGTVLMSSRAPIGYLAIARNPVTTNQGFKSFVPEKAFSGDYIYSTLKHFMKLIKANASGSTFKEISGGTLKAVRIHLPPVDLVAEFTERVSSLSLQQSLLEQQNQQLTGLRDWLLPMLMNGQVTVG
ncbi:MAG: restriction endonuclease subunit S [Nitrospira sp.]|nr:restriction endonuclease subunit S [Nitrospira sp.]